MYKFLLIAIVTVLFTGCTTYPSKPVVIKTPFEEKQDEIKRIKHKYQGHLETQGVYLGMTKSDFNILVYNRNGVDCRTEYSHMYENFHELLGKELIKEIHRSNISLDQTVVNDCKLQGIDKSNLVDAFFTEKNGEDKIYKIDSVNNFYKTPNWTNIKERIINKYGNPSAKYEKNNKCFSRWEMCWGVCTQRKEQNRLYTTELYKNRLVPKRIGSSLVVVGNIHTCTLFPKLYLELQLIDHDLQRNEVKNIKERFLKKVRESEDFKL